MMPTLTPVVKNLIIINVLVFVCMYFLPMGKLLPHFELYFFLDKPDFHPYQLVTHMFAHSGPNLSHVLFNMLSLFFLGPYVERYVGNKDFLILYLASGFGAMLAHVAIWYFEYLSTGQTNFIPVIGASGAVYGILISFAVLFPNVKMMLMFIPVPIKARYLAIGLIAYDLISGVGGFDTGIAHFAHLGGAVTGALLTFFWLKQKYRRP